jgi:hypothetical protein
MVGEVVPMGRYFKSETSTSLNNNLFLNPIQIFLLAKTKQEAIRKQERGNHKFAKFEHPTNI